MRRSSPLGLLAALTLLGACASSPYPAAQERWTVHREAYEGFAGRAFVHATLKTAPFRRAYVAEYARIFALGERDRAALLAAELDEARDSHVVIASFYTPKRAWNDLNPRHGVWEVRLDGPEGRSVRPLSVLRLSKRNPTYKALYPYQDPQFTLYELRFPRLAGDGAPVARSGERLTLVIAGAPAQIRLGWTLP